MLILISWIPGGLALLRLIFRYDKGVPEVEVFGLKFPNAVGMAAGFDKNARLHKILPSLGFGFVEVGTVTPLPQPGNPRPRLFRLKKDRGLINRMGFNNGGLDKMIGNLKDRDNKSIIGINLGKNTATDNSEAPSDYLTSFIGLYPYADYFVVNVSCPNVKNVTALQEKDSLNAILGPLVEYRNSQPVYRPLLIKISPDLAPAQVDDMIDVVAGMNLDGIVATNTSTSREGLVTPGVEVDAIGAGGLSGRPLTKRSVEMVRYIHQKTGGRYPIIGVGGIMSVEDARAMIDAGASLIQVYTGFIYNGPGFVRQICKALTNNGVVSLF